MSDYEQESSEAVDATPAAEVAAEEHGVDLSQVEGSGMEGRVVKADVEAAAAEAEDEAAEAEGSQEVPLAETEPQAIAAVKAAFPDHDEALQYAHDLIASADGDPIEAPDALTYDEARTVRETVFGIRPVDADGMPIAAGY